MKAPLNILMVASENDGIKTTKGMEAKVGGIGDVVRDVPLALAALTEPKCRVTVVIPAYGFLDKIEGARLIECYDFPFAGSREGVTLFEVPAKEPHPQVRYLVLHSARFESRHPVTNKLSIYCDDPPGRPFATDAVKFACFCAAVAEGLKRKTFGEINRLHLHDWHAASLLVLRLLDKNYEELQGLRTVFTIHNLVLQGIRPLRGDLSSLEVWYPQLALKRWEQHLKDPDYHNCYNPMAVGIRLAEAVHVVSPGYKPETLRPSTPRRGDPDAFFIGGEGLENDLQDADQAKRLFGILNGCEYDDRELPPRDQPAYQQLLKLLQVTVTVWADKAPHPRHDLALRRIESWLAQGKRPDALLTCVTRVVNQKVRLMRVPDRDPALAQILGALSGSGRLILLGTGDYNLEHFLGELSERFDNFLFLNGFDSASASGLYVNGDLFLMPSSFEPCGISQMLAMRDGQPCVGHNVGGLKDTISDGRTGFVFSGEDQEAQARGFVEAVARAVEVMRSVPADYDRIRKAAFAQRFPWSKSVQEYVRKLYR